MSTVQMIFWFITWIIHIHFQLSGDGYIKSKSALDPPMVRDTKDIYKDKTQKALSITIQYCAHLNCHSISGLSFIPVIYL